MSKSRHPSNFRDRARCVTKHPCLHNIHIPSTANLSTQVRGSRLRMSFHDTHSIAAQYITGIRGDTKPRSLGRNRLTRGSGSDSGVDEHTHAEGGNKWQRRKRNLPIHFSPFPSSLVVHLCLSVCPAILETGQCGWTWKGGMNARDDNFGAEEPRTQSRTRAIHNSR